MISLYKSLKGRLFGVKVGIGIRRFLFYPKPETLSPKP